MAARPRPVPDKHSPPARDHAQLHVSASAPATDAAPKSRNDDPDVAIKPLPTGLMCRPWRATSLTIWRRGRAPPPRTRSTASDNPPNVLATSHRNYPSRSLKRTQSTGANVFQTSSFRTPHQWLEQKPELATTIIRPLTVITARGACADRLFCRTASVDNGDAVTLPDN